MKLYIIILQGIPGSGKSTYARKFIKTRSESWVIVNRDSIRNMLGNYWIPKREKLVTEIEHKMIYESLIRKFNVIVDATNFPDKTINQIKYIALDVKMTNDLIEDIEVIIKEFKIPLWKAIWRDWKRGIFGGRKVGRKVVKQFYYKYYDKT